MKHFMTIWTYGAKLSTDINLIRNVSLVNIEKIAKGLKTSLPQLFRRI